MKPLFNHNCATCVFLGHHEGHDLYYHHGQAEETVIARYGNEGQDYCSGLGLQIASLVEAHRRAFNAGLTKEHPLNV